MEGGVLALFSACETKPRDQQDSTIANSTNGSALTGNKQ